MKPHASLAVLLMVGLFSFGGFAQPITVTDQAGMTLTFELPVRTLVSIHGIGTYYVYALGAGSQLAVAYYVGLRSAGEAPATMLRWEPRLPEILSFGDPNVEALLTKEPDVILADAGRHRSFAEVMNALGVPVVLYSAETPEAMMDAIELTASFLGEAAVAKAQAFQADHDRVTAAVADHLATISEEARVRVLFLGTTPTRTIGAGMYQTSMIHAAGGVSVSRGLPSSGWSDVNLEQILMWDPDVIVVAPYGPVEPSALLENPDWQSISAVSAGRVARMPRLIAPIDTPVPESLLGIVWLASILYPEIASLDLVEEVTAFYETYYNLTLTEDEILLFSTP